MMLKIILGFFALGHTMFFALVLWIAKEMQRTYPDRLRDSARRSYVREALCKRDHKRHMTLCLAAATAFALFGSYSWWSILSG